jgi:hypothetical protein
MRRLRVLVASIGMSLALAGVLAAPAGAYGGGADHDMWQVGLSFNCNNPDICGPNLGGFWGWAEFDRSVDGQTTWGDAQLTGCSHTVGGGGPGLAGAGHISVEIESWFIAPGSGGPHTIFASGQQTSIGHGSQVTSTSSIWTHIPADPATGTSDLFGFSPGRRHQIQVAFRPASSAASSRAAPSLGRSGRSLLGPRLTG